MDLEFRSRSIVHVAHAAHSWGATGGLLRLGLVDNQRFGGEHQTGDRRGVLDGGTSYLGGIYDTGGDHV